jgi:hypothetical protein
MCETGSHSYTYRGVTKEFNVVVTDDITEHCPPGAIACIYKGTDIYVPRGVNCSKRMAHELNHGFGLHFVDRP